MLIVDASVAVKFAIAESGADRARSLLLRREQVVAPDILVSELANALWKKELRGELDPVDRALALQAGLDPFDEFAACAPLAGRALELAVMLKHPVYDCFYLALAEMRAGTFVTADARLIARLSQSGWGGLFETL